ncbi:MAG: 5-formyltetrahydrofolate cyclo-ligase [Gammaproteobacteria bacterium]
MNKPTTLFDQKKQLRETLKQNRAEISQLDRERYSKIIADQLFELDQIRNANVVFAYISYATEVITHDILKRLLADGKNVIVPKILSPTKMIAQHLENWEDLEPGILGILTPQKGAIYCDTVDVAITPGLGFTTKGHRIGFGAGYYDRWFATHNVFASIALAFEKQIINKLPTDKNDIPVGLIVTEDRVIVPDQ